MTTVTKSLPKALSIQCGVIGALIMREMHLRFGREGIGFLWIFVEPVLFIGGVLSIRILLETTGRSGYNGVDLVTIMLTGYPPLVIWRNAVNRNTKNLRQNITLLSHRQIQPVDIVISRIALDVASVIVAFSATYIIIMSIGYAKLPADWSWFLLGWSFHIWYALACGLIVFAISEMTDIIERVVHVMTYLAMPISGMFYLVSWLPHNLRPYALLLPSVNAYEILRHGYYGDGVKTTWDMGYLTLVLLGMTFIGLSLLKLAKRLSVTD